MKDFIFHPLLISLALPVQKYSSDVYHYQIAYMENIPLSVNSMKESKTLLVNWHSFQSVSGKAATGCFYLFFCYSFFTFSLQYI
jgi:hypothetical protein